MTHEPNNGLPAAVSRWLCKICQAVVLVTIIFCGRMSLASTTATETDPVAHARQGLPTERAGTGQPRFRVIRLKNIPAHKGIEYLSDLELGTASKLPGANMLLVTAGPRQLVKAGALLNLVDSAEPFVIEKIAPVSATSDFPSIASIAAELGDISIGTFYDPPVGLIRPKGIIDVHNDSIIVVAPESQSQRIIAAVNKLRNADTGIVAMASSEPSLTTNAEVLSLLARSGMTEPNQDSLTGLEIPVENGTAAPATGANEAEGDELFDQLLRSIKEAEQRAAEAGMSRAEQVEQPAPPVEPTLPEVVPLKQEPILPVKSPAVTIEPKPAARQAGGSKLAAILERLEAIETALKTQREPEAAVTVEAPVPEAEQPEPEPVAEVPTPKIAEPNDANEAAEPDVRQNEASLEPEEIPGADELLKVDLPEQLPIDVFLGFVGEHLGLDYIYDPAKIKGNVTLRLRGKFRGTVRKKNLYEMLQQVLQFHNFVMTRNGNLVTIRPITEADVSDPPLIRPGEEKIEMGDVVVTCVFELNHIDTASAKNLLEGMKIGIGIREISETGTLIVTGYAYRMPRIQSLFRFRQLKYTMAATLAPKVKALVEQLGEISITIAKPQAVQKPTTPSRTRPTRPSTRTRPQPPTPSRPAQPTPAAPGVYLDYDERTNRILMIGFADELDVVEELITSLDVQQQDLRALWLYEIQYVDAEEVRAKLEELGIVSAGTVRPSGRITPQRDRTRPQTRPQPKGPGTAATQTPTTSAITTEEPLAGEPQVVVLETINSLLVNATEEQHVQIAIIIGYVDSEAEVSTIPYVVYPLENQDPTELAEVLNKLIQETTEQQDKEGKITQKVTKKLEEDIIIIPDPKTYSLIVYASKKNQQWISSLIQQLDEYRPQVLLDVTLVEITKNDEFTMDLDLISKSPRLEPGGMLDKLSSPSVLEPFPVNRIIEATATAGAGGTAFYADTHIQALLDLMQKKSYGRVLARPKLLVNDNEEGTITTEEQTTIVREKTDVIPGTAATTSTAVTSVSFDSYSAGITLSITPHISKGKQLQLGVELQRTDFRLKDPYVITSGDTTKTGPTPPDLLTSNVNTVVTVPDSRTVILGGLEKLTQGKGGTKVPILGDLPLIGGLFRNISNTDTQSRLYVFVKAHILRPGEEAIGQSDIELVSAKNRATFEKYESEMQKYEDWPGIKAKPMDPLRVLEQD